MFRSCFKYYYLHFFIWLISSFLNLNCNAQSTNQSEALSDMLWTTRTYVPPKTNVNYWKKKKNDNVQEKSFLESTYFDFEQWKNTRKDLSSTNEYVRQKAIKKLGVIKNPEDIDIIGNLLLNDSSVFVRRECAKVLKYYSQSPVIPFLIKALKMEDTIKVKIEIALSLSYLGEKHYSYNTLREIWEGNYGKKYECHTGFKHIGDSKSIDFLVVASKSKNIYIALDAFIVLIEMNYPNTDALLSYFLENDNDKIKISTLNALAKIKNNNQVLQIIKKIKKENKDNLYVINYCDLIIEKYYL
ncbi:MAG: HEAT repeat domain-containing protein [Bacteroidales bacterium]|nr:HEAT repeat domain-containing protein [Bacteroidales bacterium]